MSDAVAGLAELVDAELTPVLRRLGARGRGAGEQAPAEEDAQARAAVWGVLAELGVLDLIGTDPAGLLAAVELLGTALHQSPLLDTALAADLLGPAWAAPVPTGTRTAAVALWAAPVGGPLPSGAAGPAGGPDRPAALALAGGRLSGRWGFVGFVRDVSDLVVVGDGVAAVVDPGGPGVVTRRHDDVARGDLYEVDLDSAPVRDLVPVPDRAGALGRARLRQAAYLVGSCQGALELAVGHLKRRDAFGAPLAKMQSPAYRLAGLSARVAAARAYVRAAGGAGTELAGAPLAAGGDDVLAGAQALLLASRLAREVSAEAVHLHGAFGLTEACEAQLFYRRAAVDTTLLGTPTELGRVAAARLAARWSG